MPNTWFISDTHFGHNNIIKFKDDKGEVIRKFESVEEMDELMVKNWNELVRPKDRIYHLGDVVMNRRCLPILDRLNGRKVLIKGNHDIFKLKDYTKYFDDVRAYQIYPKFGVIASHIPVHSSQLEHRFKWNLHGHLHQNLVKGVINKEPNPSYINVCVEHTGYKPVSIDWLLDRIGFDKHKNQRT